MLLEKFCTGYRCERKERCYLHRDGMPGFFYISPLATREECPYFAEKPREWGAGPDEAND